MRCRGQRDAVNGMTQQHLYFFHTQPLYIFVRKQRAVDKINYITTEKFGTSSGSILMDNVGFAILICFFYVVCDVVGCSLCVVDPRSLVVPQTGPSYRSPNSRQFGDNYLETELTKPLK